MKLEWENSLLLCLFSDFTWSMGPVQRSFHLTVMALVRDGTGSYETPFSFPPTWVWTTGNPAPPQTFLLALNWLQIPSSGTVMGRRRGTIWGGSQPMVQVALVQGTGWCLDSTAKQCRFAQDNHTIKFFWWCQSLVGWFVWRKKAWCFWMWEPST